MRFFILFAVLSLMACATQPVTIYQASAVPSSRVIATQWLFPSPYTGSLIIKRDSGLMGSACTVRVFVGAVPVADLGPAEKVELFIAVGEHVVVATPNGTFCGGGVSEAAVVIRAESQKFCVLPLVRAGTFTFSQARFEPVQAKHDIQPMRDNPISSTLAFFGRPLLSSSLLP